MGVSQGECPASTMCWPATTMPEVRSSVYMGSSRSLYDEVGRRIGCEVVKFVSAEGRRWAKQSSSKRHHAPQTKIHEPLNRSPGHKP